MNKYIRAILYNYFYFVINTIFFLIITALAIHIMGEEFYGLWAILNAILLFSGIGKLGMRVVVNKFASEGGKDALDLDSIMSAAILILLVVSILITLAIMLTSKWIAAQLGLTSDRQNQFRLAIIFIALSIVPLYLSSVPFGFLLSQLKNNFAHGVEVGMNILMHSGAVVIALMWRNLIWIGLWVFIIQTMGSLIMFAIIKDMVDFKWNFQIKSLKSIINFSSFSFLENFAITLFQQFDRILVGMILGPSAAGVYSVGTSIGLRLPLITGQATEVMLTYASKTDSIKDYNALYKTYRKLSQIIGIGLGTLAAIIILWMNVFLRIWISPEYATQYSDVYRILIIAYLFTSLIRPAHQTLTGIGKVKTTSLIYFFVSILMLVSVYFLGNRFALMGVAIANLTVVFLLIYNILSYIYLRKRLPVKDVMSDLWFPILAPIIAFAITTHPIFSNLIVKLLASIILVVIGINFSTKSGFNEYLRDMFENHVS